MGEDWGVGVLANVSKQFEYGTHAYTLARTHMECSRRHRHTCTQVVMSTLTYTHTRSFKHAYTYEFLSTQKHTHSLSYTQKYTKDMSTLRSTHTLFSGYTIARYVNTSKAQAISERLHT